MVIKVCHKGLGERLQILKWWRNKYVKNLIEEIMLKNAKGKDLISALRDGCILEINRLSYRRTSNRVEPNEISWSVFTLCERTPDSVECESGFPV